MLLQRNMQISTQTIVSPLKQLQEFHSLEQVFRIYGLKTSALGKALVTLDGKEMPSLDFYTAGATEKGSLIGEFTNLADGDHCPKL